MAEKITPQLGSSFKGSASVTVEPVRASAAKSLPDAFKKIADVPFELGFTPVIHEGQIVYKNEYGKPFTYDGSGLPHLIEDAAVIRAIEIEVRNGSVLPPTPVKFGDFEGLEHKNKADEYRERFGTMEPSAISTPAPIPSMADIKVNSTNMTAKTNSVSTEFNAIKEPAGTTLNPAPDSPFNPELN